MKSYPSGALPLIRGALPSPKRPDGSFSGLRPTDRAAQEEIRYGAYLLWESEGRLENRALANWLQAETELMAGS